VLRLVVSFGCGPCGRSPIDGSSVGCWAAVLREAIFSHLNAFATCVHDQSIYQMIASPFSVEIANEQLLVRMLSRAGMFLMGAHLGSFWCCAPSECSTQGQVAMAMYPDNARKVGAIWPP
jgi:predicted LPLAT superfamily acyltransferase